MAQSKLAQSLTSLSNVKVTDNDIYANVVNKMDNPADLPTYKAGSDFKPYGSELMANPDLFNGYLSTLVKQYGVIFQKVALAQNPLSMFKKGIMPMGGNIESIVYDTVEAKQYNPFYRDAHGRTRSPFEQNLLNPVSDTYSETQDINMPVTIIDTVDTQYFQNLDQFHTYIWGKIASLVNGAVLDEFYHTKLTISKPIADNKMPTVNIKDGADISKRLAKMIKSTAKRMRYFNRDYNASGINQATLVDNIVVMVNVDRSVDLDMDYFGQLFNPENSRDFNVQYVEVDSFPSIWKYNKDHVVTEEDANMGWVDVRTNGNNYGHWYVGDTIKKGTLAKAGAPDATMVFDGSKLAAVVLDKDALQLWDMLPTTLSTTANQRGRYQNVFLNKKTLFAYIMGLNAMGIYISDAPDGKITFDDIEPDAPTAPQNIFATGSDLSVFNNVKVAVDSETSVNVPNLNSKYADLGIDTTKPLETLIPISNDTSIATVSDDGTNKLTITGVKAGSTKISVQNKAGSALFEFPVTVE